MSRNTLPDRQVRQKRLGIFTVQFVRGFAIDVEVRLQIDVSSNERPETPFASDNSDLGLYPKKAESLVSRARRAAQNGMHHIVPLSNCDWYDEGPGPNVTLRQATDKDEAFLRKLHREAMGPHVEAALGWWDTDEQEKRFAKPAVSWHQIIVLDGHPIGCLLVFSKSNAVILSRIWIIPSAQGRGIGTHLVLQVCDKAQEDGCPVRLQVLKVNRAQQLYARLGFEIVAETPTHFVMERGVSTSR